MADGTGVGRIEDNENATVTISGAPVIFEGDSGAVSQANFVIELSQADPDDNVIISYSTSDSSASAGLDYTGISNAFVTFVPGETRKSISVAVLGDTIVESAETFDVTIALGAGNTGDVTIGTPSTAVATIADDDDDAGNISVIIADAAAVEGDVLRFLVALSAAPSADVTLSFSTADGTATQADNDYTGIVNGSLVFTAGSGVSTQYIDVTTIDDAVVEGNETLQLNVVLDSGPATVANASAVGTIIGNDNPNQFNISIDDLVLAEDAGTANFTVSVSQVDALNAITLDYQTLDVTANAGSDYTATNGTVTIPAGASSATINVTIIDDNLLEPEERFQIQLALAAGNASSGAVLADGTGVGRIEDNDDAFVTISGAPVVFEGNSGAANQANFTIELSQADPDET